MDSVGALTEIEKFSNPVVSIVVVSYRRPNDLALVLQDLFNQRANFEHEIIVVLQSYSNEMKSALPQPGINERRHFIIRDFANPLGVFGARNAALDVARGEIIAFLDDDCRVPATWLDALVDAYSDPRVGGAGGYANHPGRDTVFHKVFRRVWGLDPRRFKLDSFGFHTMPESRPPQHATVADWLIGCNMSFRSSVINQVGRFDAIYGNYGFDDVDYCLRVRRNGWNLVASPGLTVDHYPSAASRDDDSYRAFEEERHRVYFAQRVCGHVRLWKWRYSFRLLRHLAVITQVALFQLKWRVPVAAIRGAIAGLRER